MTCTFIGHRDAPDSIKDKLKMILTELICEVGVDNFYVGNNGNFDRMVLSVLRELKLVYQHIEYSVILAYLPTGKYVDTEYSIFPEGIEIVPKRFAIDRRNKWMIDRAEYMISYVLYNTGGAYKFMKIGERKGVKVINIAEG